MAIQVGQSEYTPKIHPDTKHSGVVALSRLWTNIKIKSFTRDMTTASGSVAYTGIGFQPRLIIFICLNDGTAENSINFDDGVTPLGIRNGSTLDQIGNCSGIDLMATGGATEYKGVVSSFDADGFTISWTRVGAKTGTLSGYALCIR